MSCILRISGETLDVDALLSHQGLSPNRTWLKGDARSTKGKVHSDSGASFVASNANLDEFERQLTEATEYLETHTSEVTSMTATPGVKFAILDFGVALGEDSVAQFCSFPPSFIRLAASVGVGLEVSLYACSKEDDEG